MNNLYTKTLSYSAPQQVMNEGIYPYFRALQSEQDTEVIMNGRKLLMFGSNSYLGLTNHPKIKEAARAAISKYGTGCAGSRFLNGTVDLHLDLEEKLAKFVGKASCLVFSTGFQANLGVVSALIGRHDIVIIDEKVHASIIDGCRLSFGTIVKFAHNDMASLESALQRLQDKEGIKLVITDGVFSMEGEIANLSEIVALVKKYDAAFMVDDAHGLGVLGKNGRGTASHFNVTNDTDIIMGTFSKSLASIGGFIASTQDVINYIKHHARSLIFSASMPPSALASVIAALNVIKAEPERIKNLWDITHYSMDALCDNGFEIGNTKTPIIPIYIRDNQQTFLFTRLLEDEGIFVNPVVSPAVENDSSLLRFSLMATHSRSQIDFAIDKLVKIAEQINVPLGKEILQLNGSHHRS